MMNSYGYAATFGMHKRLASACVDKPEACEYLPASARTSFALTCYQEVNDCNKDCGFKDECAVKCSSRRALCMNKAQSLGTDSQVPALAIGSIKRVVAQNGLTLRYMPDTSSQAILEIPPNGAVYILAQGGLEKIDGIRANWVYVNYSGYAGWCFGGYLGGD